MRNMRYSAFDSANRPKATVRGCGSSGHTLCFTLHFEFMSVLSRNSGPCPDDENRAESVAHHRLSDAA